MWLVAVARSFGISLLHFLVTGEEVLWANYRVSWASYLQREKISKEPKLSRNLGSSAGTAGTFNMSFPCHGIELTGCNLLHALCCRRFSH